MKEDEFVQQIQDLQQRMAKLQHDASQLPLKQKKQLTQNLEQLSSALRNLQVTEETIRLLLSAVQQPKDSIIITTAKLEPPEPKIVFVNPAFEQMTGYTLDEVVDKTPRLLQGPNTDRRVLDDLRQHLVDGVPFHGEAINYRKGGAEFFVEWNITPIRNIIGEITHYVAIQRDITVRKRMEQERDRLLHQEQASRAEAEAANRVKDEFLAMLSHELRTPLTPILGWSKLLQSNKLSESQLQDALVKIEHHAKRQAQLVEDLLDLSRIVRGKLTLNLAPVTLVAPIAAALETVRMAAEARAIGIKTTLDGTVGQVMGDAGRLQQVFWNLLANAVKFSPEGSYITVELERVERYAQITVKDKGQGIHPDFLPFVFDRFRQEDSSITRKFGGLGLGLAISKQIVEAHGGKLLAASPGVGQGATFTMKLPLMVNSAPVAVVNTLENAIDLSGIEVLVVEDDPGTQEFVVFTLKQARAKVKAATSTIEALKILATTKLDVLIIDIGMPLMDGYTLIRQIRAMQVERGGQIPAIALTAYAGKYDQQQALAAGFQVHVPKPVEPVELVTIVAKLALKQ